MLHGASQATRFARQRAWRLFVLVHPSIIGDSNDRRLGADRVLPDTLLQDQLGMIALALGYLRKPKFLRDLWSYGLQRRALAWCKAVKPSDESLPIDRAGLVAMRATLERNQSMSAAAVVTPLSQVQSRAVDRPKWPCTLQRLLVFVFGIPSLLYLVIGDFPSTARLQNAFATPIVFHTLICSLIASTIWQVVVLMGLALAFSGIRKQGSAVALILHGLSLSTAVGALVFSIITLMVLPNHGPLQQISQDWLHNALKLSNPLTLITMASILGSLSWLMLTIGTPLEAALGDAIDSLVNLVQKAPGLLDFLPILNPKNWFAERSGWNTIETHQDKDLLDQIDKMNKPDNR